MKQIKQRMKSIRSYIQNAHKVAILTHQSPDGDAMGSSLAMYHYIQSFEKTAQVIVPNAFPDFLAWMPGAETVLLYDTQKAQADTYLEGADLVICTDFNDPKRIGALGDKMLSITCPKVMIDHHLYPSDFADFIVSVPEASSTCELVYEVLSTLNFQLSTPIAQCLYTGLMTDTGNFSYNSNRPQIYPMIASLIEAGVDKDAIYNAVFNQYSVDRIKLVGYCLYHKMRVFPEHHAALIYLNRTFNVVGGYIGNSDRLSAEEMKENFLAKGHEIACHGFEHTAPGMLRPFEGIQEYLNDRLCLEATLGRIIRGLAYPNSGITYLGNGADYENIRGYIKDLGFMYARSLAGDNNRFRLPSDWYN
ncbi:MAG: DHH family phosphoesterase, partial [Paludibacteraceae bacterium]|nr:DHH family phosphoesterase [Paludibacteraceae bacterium]